MKFLDLVTHIAEVDDVARMSAGRLVQQALSLRNWIIGAGVVEFEQSGEDRASYGERLLLRLADALTGTGCKGLSARNLKNFRQVALAYAGLADSCSVLFSYWDNSDFNMQQADIANRLL